MGVKDKEVVIIDFQTDHIKVWESAGEDHGSSNKTRESLAVIKEFETIVSNGHLEKLLENGYYKSLSHFEQVQTQARCIEIRIKQLDLMSDELMRSPNTFEQGVKVNLAAQLLQKAKVQLLCDSADQLCVEVRNLIAKDSDGKSRF